MATVKQAETALRSQGYKPCGGLWEKHTPQKWLRAAIDKLGNSAKITKWQIGKDYPDGI
ncbi:hypothetical protein [Methylobacter sp.]|uniref:hypothetical protein n=1 Tax=Methylobacter sp. TaxID=2051955 RepID=UPI0026008C04|nr:hypothetical protein [Methylobacter sp.]